MLLAVGDSLSMPPGQGSLLQPLLQAGDRAGGSVTCLGSASAKDGDPTAFLCPVPVFIPVSCHPTPPHIPMGHPEHPQSACGGLHLACSPTWSKLSSWGQRAAQGGTLCCCPQLSGADHLPPQWCPACSRSPPPLIPQTREPSRATEPGLVPQVNLGQTHSWLPLHQSTRLCPCKLPLLHTPLPLILVLPLGNFHFSSPLWMPTNSLSILIVCSKHPYSG